jgi:hypothetical protein
MNLALQHADQGKDLCPSHLQLWDLKSMYDIKREIFAERPQSCAVMGSVKQVQKRVLFAEVLTFH